MSELDSLLDKHVLFVGGKGGVGKTTVAAALALRAAASGRRPLLVSTDPAHSLGHVFERRIGDRVTRLAANLEALEIDPEAAADDYIDAVRDRVRGLVRGDLADEADRQIRLARHAPGAMEAALLDRIADVLLDDTRARDLIVFDTAPIGHTLRLLELPEMLAAWTEGLLRSHARSEKLRGALDHLGRAALGDAGMRRDAPEDTASGPGMSGRSDEPGSAPEDARMQRIADVLLERRRKFHRVRRLVRDPAATGFVLVMTPERLPIAETAKARRLLEEQHVPVAAVVVNRVLPADAEGEFLATRRARERAYLDEIAVMTRGLSTVRLPLLTHDVAGIEQLERVAELLFAQRESESDRAPK